MSSHQIYSFELGPMENFVYLIHDPGSGRAAVVDPAWEITQVIDFARDHGMQLTDILLTHSHQDHVNAVGRVLESFDAAVHLLKPEAEFWGHKEHPLSTHHGGDRIRLGATEIEMLHTPGHTPGSACYRVGDELITGDTLFVFGCGRCDLKGGDPEQMFTTLRRLKDHLPQHIAIRPGHNYSDKPQSTLAEQAEGNPFMQITDRAEFIQYRMVEHDRIRNTPYRAVHRSAKGDPDT